MLQGDSCSLRSDRLAWIVLLLLYCCVHLCKLSSFGSYLARALWRPYNMKVHFGTPDI